MLLFIYNSKRFKINFYVSFYWDCWVCSHRWSCNHHNAYTEVIYRYRPKYPPGTVASFTTYLVIFFLYMYAICFVRSSKRGDKFMIRGKFYCYFDIVSCVYMLISCCRMVPNSFSIYKSNILILSLAFSFSFFFFSSFH